MQIQQPHPAALLFFNDLKDIIAGQSGMIRAGISHALKVLLAFFDELVQQMGSATASGKAKLGNRPTDLYGSKTGGKQETDREVFQGHLVNPRK